jgi:hypothetical protein
MVRGLDVFRERFADYADRYVLIGGAAVEVAMHAAGLEFRVTKDLDMVLHVRSLDAEFASAFWAFIKDGGYQFRAQSSGKPVFYRFHTPDNTSFPFMIELFSAAPELVKPPSGAQLTRLPIADEALSLSAILLDEGYYDFLQRGIRIEDDLSVLSPEYIVPLKARAWIDLTARRESGAGVSSGDIKKHRNDIIRLSQLIAPTQRVELPAAIYDDLIDFVRRALLDGPEPATFGIKGMSLEDVRLLVESVYERTA